MFNFPEPYALIYCVTGVTKYNVFSMWEVVTAQTLLSVVSQMNLILLILHLHLFV